MARDTSRTGVNAVARIINDDFEWVFREQHVQDYGIDAHIEVWSNEKYPSGKLIGAQIKSGKSYLNFDKNKNIIFYIEPKHYAYWSKYSIPVVVIIHDPENNKTYWQAFSEEKVEKTKKGWKLIVPTSQDLSSKFKNDLKKLTDMPEWQRKINRLALQYDLISSVDGEHRLIVNVGEWVNKSSGRGEFEFLLVDDLGKETQIEDWPFAMFPGWPYKELFYELFPWADVSIDEDFYEDYDEDAYDLDCGIWDNEDKKYMGHTTSYSEWRDQLPSIRPYENVSGEVDFYRLELRLNGIGKSFLVLNEYLEMT